MSFGRNKDAKLGFEGEPTVKKLNFNKYFNQIKSNQLIKIKMNGKMAGLLRSAVLAIFPSISISPVTDLSKDLLLGSR